MQNDAIQQTIHPSGFSQLVGPVFLAYASKPCESQPIKAVKGVFWQEIQEH